MKVDIEFNAFIPARLGDWLPEPQSNIWDVNGNRRDFGGGSSKVFVRVCCDLDLLHSASVHPSCVKQQRVSGLVSSEVGPSLRRLRPRLSLIPSPTDPLSPVFSRPTVKDGDTYFTKYADNHSYATVTQDPATHRRLVVAMHGEAAYPFLPSPSINFDVSWYVEVRDSLCIIQLTGNHNEFPNYEALVVFRPGKSFNIYTYSTSGKGPGIWNLALLTDDIPAAAPRKFIVHFK